MCEWGTTKPVFVKIPADLSSTGEEKWKYESVDACIADIVDALQKNGIDMRGSCCGHGKMPSEIHLQDGRCVVVFDDAWWHSRFKAAGKMLWQLLKFKIWKIYSRIHSRLIQWGWLRNHKKVEGYF
jgi:hypothetical protein